MKKVILLGLLVLFLCPMTIEYTHDGVCDCDGLNPKCSKIFKERTTLVGYLSKDIDYIEDISIGW